MRWIIALQTAVGVVLIGAAVTKIGAGSSPRAFLHALGVPEVLTSLAARGLVPLEILCGLALVAGIGTGPVYGAALALTGSFAALLIVARRRGVTQGCRCFGSLDSETLTPVSIVRALVLVCAAGALLLRGTAVPSPSPLVSPDLSVLVSVLVGVCMAVVYIGSFALVAKVWEFNHLRTSLVAAAQEANDSHTHQEVTR